jgi:ABC-type glutathione transport system ATPase component
LIADRVVVLNEAGRIVADGTPAAVLANRSLLVEANLIHEHLHEHGATAHSHAHDDSDGHHDGQTAKASAG